MLSLAGRRARLGLFVVLRLWLFVATNKMGTAFTVSSTAAPFVTVRGVLSAPLGMGRRESDAGVKAIAAEREEQTVSTTGSLRWSKSQHTPAGRGGVTVGLVTSRSDLNFDRGSRKVAISLK